MLDTHRTGDGVCDRWLGSPVLLLASNIAHPGIACAVILEVELRHPFKHWVHCKWDDERQTLDYLRLSNDLCVQRQCDTVVCVRWTASRAFSKQPNTSFVAMANRCSNVAITTCQSWLTDIYTRALTVNAVIAVVVALCEVLVRFLELIDRLDLEKPRAKTSR